jgi:peptide/histidine transporter 3/4
LLALDICFGEDGVCSIDEDQEAKAVPRLIPIRATNLLYAIIDAQYSTFFTMQGASKDRTIASGFIIPTATLLSFTNLTIVMLVPVFDRICPFIKSFS